MPYRDKEKQKLAQHQSYLRNKDKIYKKFTKHRNNLRKTINELKGNGPCVDCRLEWPHYVLHYHHREPSNKIKNIARMVSSGTSVKNVMNEIEKCDLICSNCHAIREYGSVTQWTE